MSEYHGCLHHLVISCELTKVDRKIRGQIKEGCLSAKLRRQILQDLQMTHQNTGWTLLEQTRCQKHTLNKQSKTPGNRYRDSTCTPHQELNQELSVQLSRWKPTLENSGSNHRDDICKMLQMWSSTDDMVLFMSESWWKKNKHIWKRLKSSSKWKAPHHWYPLQQWPTNQSNQTKSKSAWICVYPMGLSNVNDTSTPLQMRLLQI